MSDSWFGAGVGDAGVLQPPTDGFTTAGDVGAHVLGGAGGERAVIDALADQPGAVSFDFDVDGRVDTVALDLGGTGRFDYVEHMNADGTGVSMFDGDGDGTPDVIATSAGAGGFDGIALPGDPLLGTFTFTPPAADAGGVGPGSPVFGGTAISGGSAVDTKGADELIVAADGTGYGGSADYVKGENGYEPLS